LPLRTLEVRTGEGGSAPAAAAVLEAAVWAASQDIAAAEPVEAAHDLVAVSAFDADKPAGKVFLHAV